VLLVAKKTLKIMRVKSYISNLKLTLKYFWTHAERYVLHEVLDFIEDYTQHWRLGAKREPARMYAKNKTESTNLTPRRKCQKKNSKEEACASQVSMCA
jgi:hypothetical protein